MKKGFTLIELLAVIIILAIIALIATPTILKVVDNAKESANKSSIAGYADAVKLYVVEEQFKNNGSYPSSIDDSKIGTNVNNVVCDEIIYTKSGVLLGSCKMGDKDMAYWYSNGIVTTSKPDNYDELKLNVLTKKLLLADKSGAAIPVLASNMIPIMYYNNSWVKADSGNLEGTYSWYDYSTKKWANAVTVSSTTLSTYKNASIGTPINESDILTYLVWIPRYKYLIPAGTGARTIDIVFEDKNTSKSKGDAVTTYLTHPAFTFGTEEESGFWVGKFETTGTINNITVKPNLSSLRWQTVSSFFTAMRNMEASGNIYSFDSSEVDTHMMKNNEWGAVAYLSNSNYGLNNEIYKNNSSSYYTGRSGGNVGGSQIKSGSNEYISTGFYSYDGKCATTTSTVAGIDSNCTSTDNYVSDLSLAYNASTTGTIYGVYDMSGGAHEYVMGNYNNYSGYSTTLNSGFTGPTGYDSGTYTGIAFPNSKYYNLYTDSSAATACSGGVCLGDALSETSKWNGDFNGMIRANYPWFGRGGNYNCSSDAGVFSFYFSSGNASSDSSARLIVSLEAIN